MWLIMAGVIGIPAVTTVSAAPLVEQSVELSVGQPSPDFNLTLFNGEKVSLKSFRGNAVIINFWHSMCTHCQREAPVLEAEYEKYRKRGLVIIGVNISQDEEQLAHNFAERYKLTFPVGHDTGDIGKLYAFKALPLIIFIDKAGNLVGRYMKEFTEEESRQQIEDLMK
jgi:peroxiredoxin